MKRPAIQNKQVGVLQMDFRARKVFGSFEKHTPGHKNFNAVSHKRARPEVMFSNLKHGSRSGGSCRFYLNFYSLHSVTGNVGDTDNDLSRFGNGIYCRS